MSTKNLDRFSSSFVSTTGTQYVTYQQTWYKCQRSEKVRNDNIPSPNRWTCWRARRHAPAPAVCCPSVCSAFRQWVPKSERRMVFTKACKNVDPPSPLAHLENYENGKCVKGGSGRRHETTSKLSARKTMEIWSFRFWYYHGKICSFDG